jgi:hypothetical protein
VFVRRGDGDHRAAVRAITRPSRREEADDCQDPTERFGHGLAFVPADALGRAGG